MTGQFLVCTICGHGVDWEGQAMHSQISDTTVSISRCPCWRLVCTRLKGDGTPVCWTYSEATSRTHRLSERPCVEMERYEAWGVPPDTEAEVG